MIETLLAAGILDAKPDGLVVVDGSGTIRYANSRVGELSGYDPIDLVGASVEMLVPEAERASHERSRNRHAAVGHPARDMGVELNTRLLRRDGSSLVVDIALGPLQVDDETLVVATIRDATARLQWEADRNEQQRRFSELVENVELMVVGLDLEGRVSYVNPHFCAVSGHSPEEVLGVDWLSRFSVREEQEGVQRVFGEVLAGGEGSTYHENRIRVRGGRTLTVGWFNIRLLDASGNTAGTLSIGEDLTAHHLSEQRLRAVNRVRQAIIQTGVDPEEVFAVIASEAEAMTQADLALVVTPTADGYTARAAAGMKMAGLEGAFLPEPIWRELFSRPEPTVLESAVDVIGLDLGEDLGTILVVPPPTSEVRGLLLVARGGTGVFDEQDLVTLEQLSGLTTMAVEYRHKQKQLRDLAIYEDRERIARDLHDRVIQRLFAAGLSIDIASHEIADRPLVLERLEQVVGSLDEAITELRNSIFSLHAHRRARLYDRILDLVTELTDALGFAPEVTVEAENDDIPEETLEHLLATLREALTNIARHSGADHAEIEVRVASDLRLIVEDNGRGLPANPTPGRGLHNMTERARRLGGKLTFSEANSGGLRLEWTTPIAG